MLSLRYLCYYLHNTVSAQLLEVNLPSKTVCQIPQEYSVVWHNGPQRLTKSFATAHSTLPNPALWSIAHNQILHYSLQRMTKYCVMAHSTEQNPVLWPIVQKSSQILLYSFTPHSAPQRITKSASVARSHHQIHCSGPQSIIKCVAVVQRAKPNQPQWPMARKDLKSNIQAKSNL